MALWQQKCFHIISPTQPLWFAFYCCLAYLIILEKLLLIDFEIEFSKKFSLFFYIEKWNLRLFAWHILTMESRTPHRGRFGNVVWRRRKKFLLFHRFRIF